MRVQVDESRGDHQSTRVDRIARHRDGAGGRDERDAAASDPDGPHRIQAALRIEHPAADEDDIERRRALCRDGRGRESEDRDRNRRAEHSASPSQQVYPIHGAREARRTSG